MRKSSVRTRLVRSALAFIMIVLPAAAQAGDYRPPRGDIDQRLRELEEEVRELKRQREAATEPAAGVDKSELDAILDAKLKSQKVLAGWKDGFFLESPSGDFKLKLRGYIQADARFFAGGSGDTGNDSFFLRRARPIVEGTVYKHFGFRLMPDFGGGSTTLQDGYMDVTYFPWASVRAGKFKVPLSLERLQSGAELLFIERSIAQNLAPNRDVGFQLYGDVGGGVFQYQAGIFNGVPDGGSSDGDVSSPKDLAARVWLEPFKTAEIPALEKLGFGIAGTWGRGEDDDLSSINFRTAGRSSFFRPATNTAWEAKGDHYRWSPQFYYFFGPFGAMGEYIYSDQELAGTLGTAPDTRTQREDFHHRAWFVQASWVLTGEDAGYKMVTPINNFDPRNGRWGAFEVAGRVSHIDLDGDAITSRLATGTDEAWAYTAGLNWYFNRAFKLQVNYERTDFSNKVSFSGERKDHEDVVITRFQISY